MALINEPIKISSLILKNRFVKSATAENMSDKEGNISDLYLRFYERLAKGGASLIITGNIFISKNGRTSLTSPLLDNDSKISMFKKVAEIVNRNGSKIFAQLNHGGREALVPKAPSKVRNSLTMAMPAELTKKEIEEIISEFKESAIRAKLAGFDGIQIHGAHGYLISQFLSKRANKRKDKWGGKTINERMRFLIEAYEKIREGVGNDFPVILKISGSDRIKNGLSAEDGIRICKEMEKRGLDAVEISGGTIESGFHGLRGEIPINELLEDRNIFEKAIGFVKLKDMQGKVHMKEGFNLEEAGRIKKEISIPVICVGGMRKLQFIKKILKENIIDMVSFGRPLIREPSLPNKFLKEIKDKAGCVSCNQCFVVKGPLRCNWKNK